MFRKIKIFWFALIFILIGVIFSSAAYYFNANPLTLAEIIGSKIGNAVGVGTSVTIPETPINRLAKQLDDREKELNDRQQKLNNIENNLEEKTRFQNVLLTIIFVVIVALFALILLNFYLDYKRRKNKKGE